MREYDALGDSDWKQCIRTGVSKLWAVGSIQSDASFCKVLKYSHTHLFFHDCFHTTVVELTLQRLI